MTTVVNNPSPTRDDGSAVGVVVGILVGVLLILAIWFFVVPALRSDVAPATNGSTIDLNVNLPEKTQDNSTNSGGTGGTPNGY